MTAPVRICIGTEPKTAVAMKVLRHSVLRRASVPVEFTPMIGPEWEYPSDIKVGTGFSLRRWLIPAHFNWEGLAVYMDADQLVLGDVAELLTHATGTNLVWCTWQPDKFYKEPAPQTSVMVVDCGLAVDYMPFQKEAMLQHLRDHPTREAYAAFMHAEQIRPLVGTLPVEWNHLNVYKPGKTRLLHYTKEPEQPWYVPTHPHAKVWQAELDDAVAAGAVTRADLEEALAKWKVKEDWRTQNGLHPFYRKFLPPGPKPRPVPSSARVRQDAGDARVLWVTSFAGDMWEASGRKLVASFTGGAVTGTLLVCPEGLTDADAVPEAHNVLVRPLDGDAFLKDWLARNADVIPEHLGGVHPGTCRCPGGPHDVHSEKHKLPCVGYWFNRNASRWFRKIASLRIALELARAAPGRFTAIVWVDADCAFKTRLTASVVDGAFAFRPRNSPGVHKGPGVAAAAFYLKSHRKVAETGLFGFNLAAGGDALLDKLVEKYESGGFRKDPRWDDSYQLQTVLDQAARRGVHVVDLAFSVAGHNEVVPHSVLGPYVSHDKGRHGRRLGLMT